MELTTKIQRSLLWDLKRILAASCPSGYFNRQAYDDLYKLIVGRPLEAVKLYKQLNLSLCSSPRPVLEYGSHRIPLGTNHVAVAAFRQALGMFSRLHACVTKEVEQIQLQEAAQRVAETPRMYVRGRALQYMREFVEYVIGSKPPSVDSWPCHHGPGAVAEAKMSEKHIFRTVKGAIANFIDRQAFVYDHIRVAEGLTYHKLVAPDFTRVFCLPNQPDPPMRRVPDGMVSTRVVTVPKDATKVRIISCEPASSQFVQEGLKDILYNRMARFKQINPNDQSRNQRLALAASCGYIECDTLDMSNASDNVRLVHVQNVFPYDWIQALNALRSPCMRFPDGRVVEITAFAPMGSALCFPVEMLVFASVVYAGYRLAGLTSRLSEFFSFSDWGVFGDDIVAAHAAVKYILALLKGLCIPCNVSKSCIGDVLFKEACGMDAFNGHDVSIVRPRVLSDRRVAAAPMVLHANRLFASGFVATAQVLAETVRVPVSLGYGPHLAEPRLKWPRLARVRYNAALQRFEGQAPYNRLPKPEASQDWEALYLWFTDQRTSSHPFFRMSDGVPTTIWVPLEAAYANIQEAERRKLTDYADFRIPISTGSKPVAQGTPLSEVLVARSCSSCQSMVPTIDSEFEFQQQREYFDISRCKSQQNEGQANK